MSQNMIEGAGVIPDMRESAGIGHKHRYPLQGTCPHAYATTEVATSFLTYDTKGYPVARMGDKISCGAEIIAGPRHARIDIDHPIARRGDLTYHPIYQVQGELIEGETNRISE